MAQIQTFQSEWEEHQTQPIKKHKQFGETNPNQKTIEWLETQTQLKEWVLQRAKNGEPIVVINHLNNSEHDILTMVEQVITTNEFSDDSSIFVVVPSVDNDAGNSFHHGNPSVCMQMCENSMQTLKNKEYPVGRDPKQHRNSTTNQGVKLSAKGKMFFMESLPVEMLPYHNKEVLFDRYNPIAKDEWKKRTKNKLCQISTPNEIVERVENRCNVVMDTTVDRPCCCCVKTNQLSAYNSNNIQVANVVSNVMMPHHDTQGLTDIPFYMDWGSNPRESVRTSDLPLTPGYTPQSRHHRPQRHIAALPQQFVRAPIEQLTYSPIQQYARAYSQKYTRAPITCAPTRLTWASDQQYADSCPTQNRDMACPTQHYIETCPTQNRDMAYPEQCCTEPSHTLNHDMAYPAQRRTDACLPENRNEVYPAPRYLGTCSTQQYTEACPTQQSAEPCFKKHEAGPLCQCSPEELLELFKLAVTGGKLHGIPDICGICPEPETLALAPPAEPAPGTDAAESDLTCACEMASGRKEVYMAATKQKRNSTVKQTRFISTVGTSTDDKPPRKSSWWSWRKNINICECPKAPEPQPYLDYDLEPYLTLESYFKEKDSVILSAEALKKHSLETVRVSGFRLQQDKKLPPEPETEFTVEDAIRYLAMMNPDLFQNIVAEQQAKLDGTYQPPPSPTTEEPPASDTKPEDKEMFKGLKLKLGGKGSGSKGLAGVCCFNLLTESFTTW